MHTSHRTTESKNKRKSDIISVFEIDRPIYPNGKKLIKFHTPVINEHRINTINKLSNSLIM